MNPDPRPAPPYPPARVWSFPPPPVRKVWFWTSLAAVLLSVAVFVSVVVVGVVLEAEDSPGLIDDPDVLATIDDECSVMVDRVESATPGASRSELVTSILDQNRSVVAMVDAIERIPPSVLAADRPTREWLDDWRDLVAVRAAYAEALQDTDAPDPGFRVPRDPDGVPITVRMEESLYTDVCEVPDTLVEPRVGDAAST